MDELLTTQEVAKLLKINPRTLESWRARRKGPPYRRVGDLVRYPQSELAGWVDSQKE